MNSIPNKTKKIEEIKDKWKNLQTTAMEEFAQKRSYRQTQGGPPCKKTKQAIKKIMRLFENAPSFTGLHGFEVL
jgi:hypothetical protein